MNKFTKKEYKKFCEDNHLRYSMDECYNPISPTKRRSYQDHLYWTGTEDIGVFVERESRAKYKHLKEKGFEFEVNENYGEPFRPGTYRVKRDITDLEGDIVINIDEEVIFEGKTDTIMGYDVFKYKNVYLTTEDLYANA